MNRVGLAPHLEGTRTLLITNDSDRDSVGGNETLEGAQRTYRCTAGYHTCATKESDYYPAQHYSVHTTSKTKYDTVATMPV